MANNSLRIVYAGTPDFAVPALQALLDNGYNVCAVYTQPDRPAGRGKKLQASPIKQLALDNDITVEQPISLKGKTEQATLASYQADLMIVAAYGLLLPKAVLDIPKIACWNIHASLLPRWRGASPIQAALLAGDDETGITLMNMDVGLDTGDMLLKKTTSIANEDNAQTLHDRLAKIGAELLLQGLADIENIQPQKQDNALATYAGKINKQDARIDWQQTAEQIDRKIRGYYGWPVAFTASQDKPEENIRIWSAEIMNKDKKTAAPGAVITSDKKHLIVQTGCGQLNITSLQIPGGKRLSVTEFANANDFSGKQFC